MDQFVSTLAPVSAALAIILFAVPSYVGLIRQKGLVHALAAIVVIGGVFLAILALAVQLKYPFGAFTFGEALGYSIAGLVPWTMAFAYTPLVLSTFWLSSKLTKTGLRVLVGGLLFTAMNTVLDPALALMKLRAWENGGPFYGVPALNFAGWFLCGAITTWVLHKIWGKEDDVRRSVAYSGFAIIWFWGGVNLGLKQWVPGAIGLGIGLLILVMMVIEKRRQASEKE